MRVFTDAPNSTKGLMKVLSKYRGLLGVGYGLLAMLVACSCATPYRPLKHHVGYSDRQVGTNEYEVSFFGKPESSWDRVLDFAMLRAAEIALSRHAKTFTVLDIANLSSARRYLVPSQYFWTASPYLSGGQVVPSAPEFAGGLDRAYLMATAPEERIFYEPGVRLKIMLSPGSAPGHVPYDAAEVSDRIRRKYGLG